MRLGLIGCGSMGSAIASGALAAGTVQASDVILANRTRAKAEALAGDLGATVADSASDVVAALGVDDVLVLAVKPYQIHDVIADLADDAEALSRLVVVSVAAGITLSALTDALPAGTPAVRTMPNVAARVGQSMTGIAFSDAVTEPQRVHVRALFEGLGRIAVIEDHQFGAFSALAGCSPAWLAAIADALAQAGVAQGLTKAQATRAITQSMAGTAALLATILDEGGNSMTLVDQVCSPAGTTVAGLLALQDSGMPRACHEAVAAACARDRELG
ncbi:MAG: pyrroline-5-carboxylate reductase [Actinomycetaceae bacterium]|nr:pyrroline-5-carboxylate reductase [Actinomycetaceae bacterium]MDU0970112.1 pyrroline-5-carboxylate reductase [Actinomycetaceae bacterium]